MEKKYSIKEVNNLIEKLKKKKGIKKTTINNNFKTDYNEKDKNNKIFQNEMLNINIKSDNKEKNKNLEDSNKEKDKEKIEIINKKNIINNFFDDKKNYNEYDKKIENNQNLEQKIYSNDKINNVDLKYENKNILNNKIYKVSILNNENTSNNEIIKKKFILNNSNVVEKNNNQSLDINNKTSDKEALKYNKNRTSLLKNIYDSFSYLNLNSKEKVFNSNLINEELKILNLDYDQSLERKNIIISNDNKLKNDIIDNVVNKGKPTPNNSIKYNGKNVKYISKYHISNDYLINSENNNGIILENIYNLLYNKTEYELYKNYFPVSYDGNCDFQKYNNLLLLIINNKTTKDPLIYIVAELMQFIFLNNINLDKEHIIENISIKNKIIDILYNSIIKKNCNNKNIINNQVLFNLLNNNQNMITSDIIKIDLLNNNFKTMDFILQLYNNHILNKNNSTYFYFLIMKIKENNNNLNEEIFEQIFNNFDICMFIILKFINNGFEIRNICKILVNSLSPKMNFCQYILLKIILEDHEIKNEKFYGKIFTSFLNFVSIEKLLIADYYNLILFTINSEVKKIFAKCSILIKYKYSLIKQRYEENQNDIILKQKILENIRQFGKISKNIHFLKYIKEQFYITDNNKYNVLENNSKKENEFEEDNNNNKINDNKNNDGFFSSLKYAFWFNSNESIGENSNYRNEE